MSAMSVYRTVIGKLVATSRLLNTSNISLFGSRHTLAIMCHLISIKHSNRSPEHDDKRLSPIALCVKIKQ